MDAYTVSSHDVVYRFQFCTMPLIVHQLVVSTTTKYHTIKFRTGKGSASNRNYNALSV